MVHIAISGDLAEDLNSTEPTPSGKIYVVIV
jgi:hypothetical protein